MKVLIIGPTINHIFAFCGGTIIRWITDGAQVSVLPIFGHEFELEKNSIGSLRHALKVDFLHVGLIPSPNHLICDNKVNRDSIMDVIREIDPDIIISPEKESIDQSEVSINRVVFNAAYSACVPNYVSPKLLPATKSRCPIFKYQSIDSKSEQEMHYVDVTSAWEEKIAFFKNGNNSWIESEDLVNQNLGFEVLGRARGIQAQVDFAEVFASELAWGRMPKMRFFP